MATQPNQIATVEHGKSTKVAVQAGGKLAAFVPSTIDEAWRLAGALANSGMTPKAYGNDQNKIMVGIMAGAEVGLTPFAALQSIAVIGNNPSLWGDGALGLVQASGLLDDMEETDDGATATCRLVRKGRKTPIVRTFSMEDAKKAGLAGKSGPWTQYPARMRQMRARSFALRDGFSDVLRGLHIVEEVRDYQPMGSAVIEVRSEPLTASMIEDHQEGRAPSGMGERHNGTDDEETARHLDEVFDPRTGEITSGDDAGPDWTATVASIKAEMEARTTAPDVNSYWSSIKALVEDMPDAMRDEIENAKAARILAIRKGE